MDSTIHIDQKYINNIKADILALLKAKNNLLGMIDNCKTKKIEIYISYPEIKKIINNLRLFPTDIDNIINEYMNNKIIIEYCINVRIPAVIPCILIIITYSANNYIDERKIKFKYAHNCAVFSNRISNNFTSIDFNNPMSFFKESLTSNPVDQYMLIDDHIHFINFYMKKYKTNYLNVSGYTVYTPSDMDYTYTEKNNIFYGKRFGHSDNKITTYNITRRIVNKNHLIICAKIIRKLSKIINKISTSLQPTIC
jgi:hypothetical protein